MAKILKRAAYISFFTNLFLFALKLFAGLVSNSIAVLSEAMNSLTDIISSAAIMLSVRISLKQPDKDHQFGHNAAQPLAVFIIVLFTGIVALKVIEASIDRIINPAEPQIDIFIYAIMFTTVIVKIFLSRYQFSVGKQFGSPGLKASGVDSLSDVLSSSLSIVGIAGIQLGYPYLDGAAGIAIALFIFRAGYLIAKENIDYLMGKAADDELVLEIANIALKTDGVRGINELKSHYVGNKFHVEIHIDVEKSISTEISHDIGVEVREAICKLPEVSKVFVHIDPV